MMVLMMVFGVGRVATETKTSVRNWKSFLNFWMFAYVLLLGALMSVTTSMALVLLVDANGAPRVDFIPPSTISIAAAVVGVFGFEFLFRKFVIGFGENKFDLETTCKISLTRRLRQLSKEKARAEQRNTQFEAKVAFLYSWRY